MIINGLTIETEEREAANGDAYYLYHWTCRTCGKTDYEYSKLEAIVYGDYHRDTEHLTNSPTAGSGYEETE